MKRLALWLVAVSLLPAGVAWAHTGVKSVSPKKSSTRDAVREVHVTFEDHVITGLIEVKRGSSVVAARRTGLKPSNHAVVQWIPKAPLAPGGYTANWRARAEDGHSEKGSWKFRVR
jgi:methionine-rich copper-binding protein CopC